LLRHAVHLRPTASLPVASTPAGAPNPAGPLPRRHRPDSGGAGAREPGGRRPGACGRRDGGPTWGAHAAACGGTWMIRLFVDGT